MGVGPADVAEQRRLSIGCRGSGHGEGHPQDGVGTQSTLVVGSVDVAERLVDGPLVVGVQAVDGGRQLAVHVAHRGRYTLPSPCRAAVAEFHCLEHSGRRAAGDHGTA